MRLIWAAALVALALSSASGAESLRGAAAGAAATVDAFHAALTAGNTAAAARLLAEQALIFESGEVEHGKAEYVAHHLPADADLQPAATSAPA